MQIVRKTVADLREMYHREAGREDYQFRLGDEFVVDATTEGGMARYINHSCAPNCCSMQYSVEGQLHLGIFALCTIKEGEELCYDYKVRSFPDYNSQINDLQLQWWHCRDLVLSQVKLV
jgi:SET domain-containing protein